MFFSGESDNIVICISPLTAIMIDQKEKFKAKGIIAEFVGEAQTDYSVKDKVIQGKIELVFISPENILCNSNYWNMLRSSEYKDKLVAVAVDEAHCVKTW